MQLILYKGNFCFEINLIFLDIFNLFNYIRETRKMSFTYNKITEKDKNHKSSITEKKYTKKQEMEFLLLEISKELQNIEDCNNLCLQPQNRSNKKSDTKNYKKNFGLNNLEFFNKLVQIKSSLIRKFRSSSLYLKENKLNSITKNEACLKNNYLLELRNIRIYKENVDEIIDTYILKRSQFIKSRKKFYQLSQNELISIKSSFELKITLDKFFEKNSNKAMNFSKVEKKNLPVLDDEIKEIDFEFSKIKNYIKDIESNLEKSELKLLSIKMQRSEDQSLVDMFYSSLITKCEIPRLDLKSINYWNNNIKKTQKIVFNNEKKNLQMQLLNLLSSIDKNRYSQKIIFSTDAHVNKNLSEYLNNRLNRNTSQKKFSKSSKSNNRLPKVENIKEATIRRNKSENLLKRKKTSIFNSKINSSKIKFEFKEKECNKVEESKFSNFSKSKLPFLINKQSINKNTNSSSYSIKKVLLMNKCHIKTEPSYNETYNDIYSNDGNLKLKKEDKKKIFYFIKNKKREEKYIKKHFSEKKKKISAAKKRKISQ